MLMTSSDVPTAVGIETAERLERLLTPLGRDAGTVILDRDHQIVVGAGGGEADLAAVFQGVVDEIDDAALERVALDHHGHCQFGTLIGGEAFVAMLATPPPADEIALIANPGVNDSSV